ncbi:BcNRPS1, nonribosomal peptide synthetase [Hypoxylon rubiginosum]|uniref:BcNRPS1, nonribosomal peptide synthetase n=1 Tax=Hypoxylon rubiginosum TaxID=110542 RepID=A0ACB9YJ33_9PEZI|nr:BcNRPS1, nonribosomal peptide synthetase [Hypoxylon rubiginosum]
MSSTNQQRWVDHASRAQTTQSPLLREIALELKVPPHEIDFNTSFVSNGGDSLAAIKIVSSCISKGMAITVAMIMSFNSVQNLVHDFDQRNKSHLLHYKTNTAVPDILPAKKNILLSDIRPDKPVESRRCQPTGIQLHLVHGSKTLQGRNVVRYYETYRTEDIPLVKSSWAAIISTEPIFRTRFHSFEESTYLAEESEAPFIWEEVTVDSQRAYISTLEKHDFPLDFIGTAFKTVHFKTDTEARESTVVWNIHHALIDGYSSVLLLNKHRNHLAGSPIVAGPSFVRLINQLASLQHTWEPLGRAFWDGQETQLRTSNSELHLPIPGLPFNPVYAHKHMSLDVAHEDLFQYAKGTGVTVASVLYAAWAMTLSNYVDSNHVSFGIVLSGRSLPLPDAAHVVGPLINTVPFQVCLDPLMGVPEYLKFIFSHAVELDRFQWAIPEHGVTKPFSSVLNIHFESPLLHPNPLHTLRKPRASMASELPLSVNIHLDGNIQLFYHEHQFYASDVERLGRLFAKAVGALVKSNLTVGQCCDAVVSDELGQLWENGNCSALGPMPQLWQQNLVHLFDLAAVTNSDAIAIEKDVHTVTYSQLHQSAMTVTRHLTHHVTPGDVVCVHADRSVNWIIAIYGILRAGGVYCPLDDALPADVRNQNFHQSGARILLTGSTSAKKYVPDSCGECLSVEDILKTGNDLSGTSSLAAQCSNLIASPEAGAYLCFTSGSTGFPKGVLCTHQSIVAFQNDFDVRLKSRVGWRIAQVMSPAFDGSIHEIFSALSYGSTLVLRNTIDPLEHLSKVDASVLTPSLAKVLRPHNFKSLRALYLVGEAVPQTVCDEWASKVSLYNMYGPTEATCGATIKQLQPGQPVTLGKPNPSTRIYILDSRGKFVPIGVVGEIYLAGVQVSRGYINRPDENATWFLPDHIHSGVGERMYRTGDRGYWDEQGELHFCGRRDRQIKLRGFRIDLDDIEVRIRNAVPGCTMVAVARDNDYLVAQLQPETVQSTNARKFICKALPSYAVPRQIMTVSEFPRTNAGKVDYVGIIDAITTSLNIPAMLDDSGLFSQLAQVWRDVLGRQDLVLRAESNFYELGGHSLLQLKLVNRLSGLLGYRIPLTAIIGSATLGDLTEKLAMPPLPDMCLTQIPSNPPSVSPIEEDWHRMYQFNGGSSSFNVAMPFELGPDVDLHNLANAWESVLDRHEIFRSRFRVTPDGTVQKTFSETPPRVIRTDHVNTHEEINRHFDLEHDSLIRILLAPNTLLLVASHIICDYTSLNTMLREVSCTYLGTTLERPAQLSSSIRQRVQPTTQEIEFWQSYLEDTAAIPSYSIGRWSRRSSYSGTSFVHRIPSEVFSKLRQFTSSHQVTAHQLSLATVSLALQHQSDEIDIVLGAPHLGRSSEEEQNLVGLFLEPLPIRIRYPPPVSSRTSKSFVQVVQESSQEALSHAIPWNLLLKSLGTTTAPPNTPLFDVMVSYHENFGCIGMKGIDAKPVFTWSEGAKFKLMVEFVVANDTSLLMRLEYSDECFNAASIAVVGRLIASALGMIVNGMSHETIRTHLSKLRKGGNAGGVHHAREYCGMKYESL